MRGLAGQVRYAREYVGREILAPLPHELVDLLRTTSVLESLTGRRCDLLLGTTHSQRRLLELERRGVLTASTTGSGSFRLPTVLRAHLATQLRDELGDPATEAWLCDAARVTTVEPGPDGAAETVRLYAAAGAWPQVLDIMERRGRRVLASPDLDWVDAAPRGLRRDETWLRLVDATRAVRDGRFEVAARYAAIPEETETTPEAQRLGRCLARMARQWTVGDLEPDGSWFEGLRAELRRPAPQPRRVAGSPEQALLGSIGLALSGDVRAARQRLGGSLVSLHGDPLASLTGQLLAELLGPSDSAGAEALADRAESLGMPWFARMGHGLAAALDDVGTESVSSLILDSENRGDAWGALLLAGIRCVTSLRAGRVNPGHFDDLVARCRTMDCPALEAWARAGLALAAAAANLPDAAREGRSAEGYARCAAVPGAVAVSYGALAVSAVDESSELRVLAETEAEAVGLDCRPWTWVDTAEPALPSRAHVADVPAVAIRCFGGFELRVAGDAPPLTRVRPKARALLRLLALNAGRPVHRETLIDALWPDLDVAAGTHNLQVYVSSLRTLLEPGVLRGASRLVVRDSDRYTLRLPDSSSCDVQEFEIATAEAERSRALGDLDSAVAALEKAMLLYVGDLLPEDGPAEWVTGPRDHYRIRAAEAGAALAELLLARDLPDRAAAAALRSIDIEPCRDGSWRLLLAAYGASGDLAAAEHTRRSYAEVLASLGVVSEHAHAVRPRRSGS